MTSDYRTIADDTNLAPIDQESSWRSHWSWQHETHFRKLGLDAHAINLQVGAASLIGLCDDMLIWRGSEASKS